MAEYVEVRATDPPGKVRTVTAADGEWPPLSDASAWAALNNGDKPRAHIDLDLDVTGSGTTQNEPVVTVRSYLRGSNYAAANTDAVYHVSRRLYDMTATRYNSTSGVKIAKTANAGVAWTDYSGTTVDLSSLDTYANGDYLLIGSPNQFQGADITILTANGNASVLTAYYNASGTFTTVGASLSDKTASGGVTLAATGQVTFARPATRTTWTVGVPAAIKTALDAALTIDADDYYWIQLRFSAALDADTTFTLEVIQPILANFCIPVYGRDVFAAIHGVANAEGIVDANAMTVAGRIITSYV